jgi:hypothetical protein
MPTFLPLNFNALALATGAVVDTHFGQALANGFYIAGVSAYESGYATVDADFCLVVF